jgi:hypothetical protein
MWTRVLVTRHNNNSEKAAAAQAQDSLKIAMLDFLNFDESERNFQ